MRTRTLVGAAVAVAGVLLALFYAGLLLVADCSADCWRRGEPLIPIGLAAAGLGLAWWGTRVALEPPR